MITGFNTDVQHQGVTYHVQTEDKGLDSPLILSLVYVGGAIIASKRTPYEDLVGQGFDEQALTERLQRQHKLICAAIKAGRVEDLKRMGGPNGGASQPQSDSEAVPPAGRKTPGPRRKKAEAAAPPPAETPTPVVEQPPSPTVEEASASTTVEAPTLPAEPAPLPVEALPAETDAHAPAPAVAVKAEPEFVILTTLSDEVSAIGDFVARAEPKPEPEPSVQATPAVEVPSAEANGAPPVPEALGGAGAPPELSNEIYLSLLDDEGEFRAGQLVTIKVYVGRGTYGQRAQPDASVTVKVLGTSFRPIIMTATTDALGVGVVRTLLPRFTSGRAAIIIRAALGEDSAEMRRIIHQ